MSAIEKFYCITKVACFFIISSAIHILKSVGRPNFYNDSFHALKNNARYLWCVQCQRPESKLKQNTAHTIFVAHCKLTLSPSYNLLRSQTSPFIVVTLITIYEWKICSYLNLYRPRYSQQGISTVVLWSLDK